MTIKLPYFVFFIAYFNYFVLSISRKSNKLLPPLFTPVFRTGFRISALNNTTQTAKAKEGEQQASREGKGENQRVSVMQQGEGSAY